MAHSGEEAALEPVRFFRKPTPLNRVEIQTTGAQRRGEVMHNRRAGFKIRRAECHKARSAVVNHQRQDRQLKGEIGRIESRRWKFPYGKLATDPTFGQTCVEQDRAVRQRIVFLRRIQRDERVSNPQLRQMVSQNVCAFGGVERGKQLRGHQSQAICHLHMLQQRVGRLTLHLFGDFEAGAVNHRVGENEIRPRNQRQQVGQPATQHRERGVPRVRVFSMHFEPIEELLHRSVE